jgi:hypothetical protein
MTRHTYERTPETSPEQDYERNGAVSSEFDPTLSEPQPRDAVYGAQWGPTPMPIQEPTSTPKGAKRGVLLIVGAVLVVALVLLVIALATS